MPSHQEAFSENTKGVSGANRASARREFQTQGLASDYLGGGEGGLSEQGERGDSLESDPEARSHRASGTMGPREDFGFYCKRSWKSLVSFE